MTVGTQVPFQFSGGSRQENNRGNATHEAYRRSSTTVSKKVAWVWRGSLAIRVTCKPTTAQPLGAPRSRRSNGMTGIDSAAEMAADAPRCDETLVTVR